MGPDHAAIPKDLRPLNIVREGFSPNPPHEPTTTSTSTTAVSPRSGTATAPLPSMISDSGLGFVNPGTAWNHSKPATTGASAGFGGLGFREGTNLNSLGVNGRVSGGNASDEIVGDSSNSQKVKFLCSFGGKILPRPSDSVLRYVGGHTRIISVRRDIRFEEFVHKMAETYGQPVSVMIKYQLPDEDLDALVSVSCAEDLENMIEEYGKLVERSADGSAKLRVFLFSPSEVEESVLAHFSDFQDNGQRFVEAVNGIPDVVGSSRLTRRGSIVSATSTQNSEGVTSACDVLDSYGTTGLGEVGGLISPGTTSPRAAAGAAAATVAPDVAARSLYMVPNSVIYMETPVVTMGHTVVALAPSESEQPKAAPAVGRQQQAVAADLRGTYGMEFSTGSTYVPSMDFPSSGASKDPRQDTFNIVNSTQFPFNSGFSATQAVGLDGSLYRHIDHSQQLRDGFAALPPHHVIPIMQMTVPSSAAPVSTRPNAVPQSSQPHQSQLHMYGYQPQSPPFLVPVTLQGGVVEWRQVPPPDHVVLSDGLTSHQQRPPLPESIPSFEDCYMCQKALPHAHSDTLIHDQRDNSLNALNPAFHSLRAEDNLWIQHPNRLPLSESSSESIAEHQGAKSQPRLAGQINHDTFVPQLGVHGLASNHESLNDHESILLQKQGISDPSNMFSPATAGSPSDTYAHYGVHMGNAPQFFQEVLLPQQKVPLQDQVNHTAYLVNQPVGNDAGPIKPLHIKPPGQVVQESAMDYISKNPGIVAKDEIVGSRATSDLRPIDGRMEALHISPPEVSGMIEQNVLPVGREQKHEEYADVKPQMTGNTIYKNNGVSRPGIVPEPLRLVETQSIPMAEGVQLNFRQPIETNQVTVSESYNVSGPHPPVTASIPLMTSEEIWQGRPSFANVGPVHANTGGLSPGEDWKYEASHVNSRMDANITAAGASSDTFSSSSPSYVGDAQNAISANSLFSNQDPWSLRHDSHFPPPRPTKVPASKEAFVVKEETVIPQPSGHVHDLGSENTRSVKGSSDEHIKQELQAVAEGVAASVLQSSTTSDLNGCGTIGSTSEAYQHREDNDGDEEARCTNQLEDGKSDLLEKMTPAFPFAENIGRLQIIKNSDLEELRELGSGTFGTVYHGKWRGSDVAIKRINDRCFSGKPSEQDRMRHDFWNEAIKLADLHHPNVVAFYGVVLDGPGGSVATVTEYMVNGSLRQALIRNDRTLDKRKRLLIAMDVAFGMEYLHGKNLVHFDLKSDNLLVNLRDPHRPICKVGDLGLSKLKCQTLISGGVRGTLPWMAPELLNGSSNLVSEKVDVFSFGIVMWELLTGEEPYADLHYGAIIGGIVNNTLRPPVPESCDPEWRVLMERCWAAEPSERPSFTEIANQLRSMAASLPPKGQAQHNNSSQPQAQK